MAFPAQVLSMIPADSSLASRRNQSIFGRAIAVFTILFNCKQEYESTNLCSHRFLRSKSQISRAAAAARRPPWNIGVQPEQMVPSVSMSSDIGNQMSGYLEIEAM